LISWFLGETSEAVHGFILVWLAWALPVVGVFPRAAGRG